MAFGSLGVFLSGDNRLRWLGAVAHLSNVDKHQVIHPSISYATGDSFHRAPSPAHGMENSTTRSRSLMSHNARGQSPDWLWNPNGRPIRRVRTRVGCYSGILTGCSWARGAESAGILFEGSVHASDVASYLLTGGHLGGVLGLFTAAAF
jgi:hypothetical protein